MDDRAAQIELCLLGFGVKSCPSLGWLYTGNCLAWKTLPKGCAIASIAQNLVRVHKVFPCKSVDQILYKILLKQAISPSVNSGRNVKGQSNNPCRVNAVPRPIPDKKWFLEPILIILLGGVLPFGCIFIEM